MKKKKYAASKKPDGTVEFVTTEVVENVDDLRLKRAKAEQALVSAKKYADFYQKQAEMLQEELADLETAIAAIDFSK